MPAGLLWPGEGVVTLDGSGTVAWVHVVPGQADMYNLTVAKDHTYAVGDDQAVVHNTDCPKPGEVSEFTQQEVENNWKEQEKAYAKNQTVGTVVYEGVYEDVEFGFTNVGRGGPHVEEVMANSIVSTVQRLVDEGYQGNMLVTAISGNDICPEVCLPALPGYVDQIQAAAAGSGLNVEVQFVSWYRLLGGIAIHVP